MIDNATTTVLLSLIALLIPAVLALTISVTKLTDQLSYLTTDTKKEFKTVWKKLTSHDARFDALEKRENIEKRY